MVEKVDSLPEFTKTYTNFQTPSSALDPEHTEKLQDGSKLIKGNLLGQDLDKIVTDYMTGLCAFVKEHLARQLTHAVVDTTPFEYVVTVPAIWSDRAKQRTVDAFARAMGADRSAIHPVTEPEAAATCVLHQTAHQAQAPPHGGRALSAGDCFVVVDAGGGTVDLISYTIKDPPPRLSVSEAAPGSGAACGAAFLNERFQRLVVETLGQEDGFDGNILRDTLEKWETMVRADWGLNLSCLCAHMDARRECRSNDASRWQTCPARRTPFPWRASRTTEP